MNVEILLQVAEIVALGLLILRFSREKGKDSKDDGKVTGKSNGFLS